MGASLSDEAGAAAKRGNAVEAGLDHILFSETTLDEAIAKALENFALNTEGEITEEIDKERAVIPDMLEKAAEAVTPVATKWGAEPKKAEAKK